MALLQLLALVLFIFGIYVFVRRMGRREVPEEAREFGARLGRSAHAAIPLPGLTGQSSADFINTEPIKDEVGTEEHHMLVLDASGRPVAEPPPPPTPDPAGPYREPPEAPKPRPRRARREP